MSEPVRVAIVQPAMAPYRFASFNALARRPDVELLVAYLSRGRQPYDWSADEKNASFPRIDLRARERWAVHPLPRRLYSTLRAFGPDVTIVGGWHEPAYFMPMALRPLLGRRVVVWTESTNADRRRSHRAKDALKRLMLERADAVLLPGSAAQSYCDSLRARIRRSFTAPNAVDNSFFERVDERPRREPLLGDRPVFLYVGRLDEEKGVDILLRAWGATGEAHGGTLLVVGSGSQERRLRTLASSLELRRVRFTGFVPQARLPDWYGRADVFVFPSLSDPWGMVINEAMASALPVITTSVPGAVPELIGEGENGLIVPPGDVDALAASIEHLAGDSALTQSMGRASKKRIATFTPERWAEAVATMATEVR